MMRRKRRYMLIESLYEIAYVDGFERELALGMLSVMGQLGFHKSNPRIIQFVDSKHFVLCVGLDGYHDSVLALSMLKMLRGKECAFYTLRTSGTLMALRSSLSEYGLFDMGNG